MTLYLKQGMGSVLACLYATSLRLLHPQPSSPERLDLNKVQKILVLRTDQIGDFVMTTPLLRELRKNLPQAQVHLVVHPQNQPLAEVCPYVDEVKVYDASKKGQFTLMSCPSKAKRFAAAQLKTQGYDLAIVPRRHIDIHHGVFLAYLSHAKSRVGWSEKTFEDKSWWNRGFDSLLTNVIHDPSGYHEVEANLHVLEFLGAKVEKSEQELWTQSGDDATAERLIQETPFAGQKKIAICLGAGEIKRQWCVQKYAKVANWLQQESDYGVILLGGSQDQDLASAFESSFKGSLLNAVGKVSLRESVALLKRSDLYLGNDTGPAHMAAACGISVAVVSCHPVGGSAVSMNAPERIAPWSSNKVIIRPQAGEKIADISVEQVKEALGVIL